MNVIVMLGMMGLMLLIFHGRGHHQPSPKPTQHANETAASPYAPPDSTEAARPLVEPRAPETRDEPGGSPEGQPTPPPVVPDASQAE